MISGDLAVAVRECLYEITTADKASRLRAPGIFVLRRSNGGWRIRRDFSGKLLRPGSQYMTPRSAAAAVFPRLYGPAAWLPTLAITAGFSGVEALVHGSHAVAPTVGLTAWEAIYRAGFAVGLAPMLLPAIRSTPGAIRRVLVGLLLILTFGAGLALIAAPLEFEAVPCLVVAGASFVLFSFARHGSAFPAAAALGAGMLVALSTPLTQRHHGLDVLAASIAGYGACRLAFSRKLSFLDAPSPWAGVDYEVRNLANLFIRNSRRNWERTYADGRWDFLDSPTQRPRHYVVAGLVADRFTEGEARVLDVGCGYATLYPLLRERIAAYTGLDLSEEALRKCRASFQSDARCRFIQGAFEDFSVGDTFDVVVLNEVLYYFPVQMAESILHKAASLAADDGVVIVSMNRAWKAALIWRRLAQVSRPSQSIRATNRQTGSYWTVNLYPAAELRGL